MDAIGGAAVEGIGQDAEKAASKAAMKVIKRAEEPVAPGGSASIRTFTKEKKQTPL